MRCVWDKIIWFDVIFIDWSIDRWFFCLKWFKCAMDKFIEKNIYQDQTVKVKV